MNSSVLSFLNSVQILCDPTIWKSDIVFLFAFICCLQHPFTYVAVLRGSADGVGKGTHGDSHAVLHVSADTWELYLGLGAQGTENKTVVQGVC